MGESMDNMGERRRMQRVAFETEVRLNVGGMEIRVFGSTRDLSQKGVFVATEIPLAEGAECQVEILLSGMEEPVCLSMKGRIARIVSEGVGVEFFEMDLDTFTHLRNVVLYNSRDADSL